MTRRTYDSLADPCFDDLRGTEEETKYNRALGLLRRIPDDIILSMATREFTMIEPSSCVCGWALRTVMEKESGIPAERVVRHEHVVEGLARRFGGGQIKWGWLFYGVCSSPDSLEAIELAFTDRVAEAVARSATP